MLLLQEQLPAVYDRSCPSQRRFEKQIKNSVQKHHISLMTDPDRDEQIQSRHCIKCTVFKPVGLPASG